MTDKYQGHAGQGGLQNHSVGALYPYIVFGQETPHGTRYGVQNGATGASIPAQYEFASEAYAMAERFKRYDVNREKLAATSRLRAAADAVPAECSAIDNGSDQ